MSKYFYQARHSSGAVKSGVLEAFNEQDARVRLRAMKLEPVRLVQATAQQKAAAVAAASNFFTPSVTPKELQVFTRQLSTLINAGIPVVDGLKILIDGSKAGPLKNALLSVKADLETGKKFSTTLAQHPKIFDRLYCNLVEAGEEAGILDQILNRLSTYLEKSQKIKAQVKGALVLPIVIICFSFLVNCLISLELT